MADTMVAPTNKPVAQVGGVKKARTTGAVVPSAAAEAASAKKKAGAMLKKGLISPAQHGALSAKADKVISMSGGARPPASPKAPAAPMVGGDMDRDGM